MTLLTAQSIFCHCITWAFSYYAFSLYLATRDGQERVALDIVILKSFALKLMLYSMNILVTRDDLRIRCYLLDSVITHETGQQVVASVYWYMLTIFNRNVIA